MLDPIHTNQQPLRTIGRDYGADFLLPVKFNHKGLRIAARHAMPERPECPHVNAIKTAPAAGSPRVATEGNSPLRSLTLPPHANTR